MKLTRFIPNEDARHYSSGTDNPCCVCGTQCTNHVPSAMLVKVDTPYKLAIAHSFEPSEATPANAMWEVSVHPQCLAQLEGNEAVPYPLLERARWGNPSGTVVWDGRDLSQHFVLFAHNTTDTDPLDVSNFDSIERYLTDLSVKLAVSPESEAHWFVGSFSNGIGEADTDYIFVKPDAPAEFLEVCESILATVNRREPLDTEDYEMRLSEYLEDEDENF